MTSSLKLRIQWGRRLTVEGRVYKLDCRSVNSRGTRITSPPGLAASSTVAPNVCSRNVMRRTSNSIPQSRYQLVFFWFRSVGKHALLGKHPLLAITARYTHILRRSGYLCNGDVTPVMKFKVFPDTNFSAASVLITSWLAAFWGMRSSAVGARLALTEVPVTWEAGIRPRR